MRLDDLTVLGSKALMATCSPRHFVAQTLSCIDYLRQEGILHG